MESLPALRYCFAIVTEREKADPESAWQWAIRRKVLRWSIARLERQSESPVSRDEHPSSSLTPDEKRALESSHPLLRSALAGRPAPFEASGAWRAAIHARVQKYVESLARR